VSISAISVALAAPAAAPAAAQDLKKFFFPLPSHPLSSSYGALKEERRRQKREERRARVTPAVDKLVAEPSLSSPFGNFFPFSALVGRYFRLLPRFVRSAKMSTAEVRETLREFRPSTTAAAKLNFWGAAIYPMKRPFSAGDVELSRSFVGARDGACGGNKRGGEGDAPFFRALLPFGI
jgi:hypothetical protein